MAQQARGKKKTRTGIVVSDKMDKTIVVRVSGLVKHRAFKKYIMRSVKYKVHDELNECCAGDTVLIEETRPLSKEKHWKVKEILERAYTMHSPKQSWAKSSVRKIAARIVPNAADAFAIVARRK